MASKNETVDEVCGELKEVANGNNVSNDGLVVEISQEEIWGALDRIEAAHKREIAELQRRIKVAEDALDKIYKCIDNRFGVDASMLAKSITADALAAIRK